MRRLANLFLILFLIDGGVSLLDDLLSQFLQAVHLTGARSLLAFIVIGLSIVLYICLGLDKRLPKRIFLPLILFTIWCALGIWPLSIMPDFKAYDWTASATQLILGLVPLFYFRKMGTNSFLMTKEMFLSSAFGVRNTILFSIANIIILPFALLFIGVASASTYIYNQSAGFVQIRPSSIHMAERIYRLDDQAVRLTGMIHIGEKSFYEELVASISSGRTIVLAEGISDIDHLMKNKFGYEKMAALLGLVSQEKMTFNGKVIAPDKFEDPNWKGDHSSAPHIIRADIDLNQLHPDTIEFLNVIGKHLSNDTTFLNRFQAYNAWIEQHLTPELKQTLMDDILLKRNREVIRYLDNALGKYDTIVIPWGALHMPAIEKAVLDRGFKLVEARRRTSIDFKNIPYAQLYRKLTKSTRRTSKVF